jgi:hypothetical protein
MNGFRFIPASVAMLGATAALLAGAAHDHDSHVAAVAVVAGVAALALLVADGLVTRARGGRPGRAREASPNDVARDGVADGGAEPAGVSEPRAEGDGAPAFGAAPNEPSEAQAADQGPGGPT